MIGGRREKLLLDSDRMCVQERIDGIERGVTAYYTSSKCLLSLGWCAPSVQRCAVCMCMFMCRCAACCSMCSGDAGVCRGVQEKGAGGAGGGGAGGAGAGDKG